MSIDKNITRIGISIVAICAALSGIFGLIAVTLDRWTSAQEITTSSSPRGITAGLYSVCRNNAGCVFSASALHSELQDTSCESTPGARAEQARALSIAAMCLLVAGALSAMTVTVFALLLAGFGAASDLEIGERVEAVTGASDSNEKKESDEMVVVVTSPARRGGGSDGAAAAASSSSSQPQKRVVRWKRHQQQQTKKQQQQQEEGNFVLSPGCVITMSMFVVPLLILTCLFFSGALISWSVLESTVVNCDWDVPLCKTIVQRSGLLGGVGGTAASSGNATTTTTLMPLTTTTTRAASSGFAVNCGAGPSFLLVAASIALAGFAGVLMVVVRCCCSGADGDKKKTEEEVAAKTQQTHSSSNKYRDLDNDTSSAAAAAVAPPSLNGTVNSLAGSMTHPPPRRPPLHGAALHHAATHHKHDDDDDDFSDVEQQDDEVVRSAAPVHHAAAKRPPPPHSHSRPSAAAAAATTVEHHKDVVDEDLQFSKTTTVLRAAPPPRSTAAAPPTTNRRTQSTVLLAEHFVLRQEALDRHARYLASLIVSARVLDTEKKHRDNIRQVEAELSEELFYGASVTLSSARGAGKAGRPPAAPVPAGKKQQQQQQQPSAAVVASAQRRHWASPHAHGFAKEKPALRVVDVAKDTEKLALQFAEVAKMAVIIEEEPQQQEQQVQQPPAPPPARRSVSILSNNSSNWPGTPRIPGENPQGLAASMKQYSQQNRNNKQRRGASEDVDEITASSVTSYPESAAGTGKLPFNLASGSGRRLQGGAMALSATEDFSGALTEDLMSESHHLGDAAKKQQQQQQQPAARKEANQQMQVVEKDEQQQQEQQQQQQKPAAPPVVPPLKVKTLMAPLPERIAPSPTREDVVEEKKNSSQQRRNSLPPMKQHDRVMSDFAATPSVDYLRAAVARAAKHPGLDDSDSSRESSTLTDTSTTSGGTKTPVVVQHSEQQQQHEDAVAKKRRAPPPPPPRSSPSPAKQQQHHDPQRLPTLLHVSAPSPSSSSNININNNSNNNDASPPAATQPTGGRFFSAHSHTVAAHSIAELSPPMQHQDYSVDNVNALAAQHSSSRFAPSSASRSVSAASTATPASVPILPTPTIERFRQQSARVVQQAQRAVSASRSNSSRSATPLRGTQKQEQQQQVVNDDEAEPQPDSYVASPIVKQDDDDGLVKFPAAAAKQNSGRFAVSVKHVDPSPQEAFTTFYDRDPPPPATAPAAPAAVKSAAAAAATTTSANNSRPSSRSRPTSFSDYWSSEAVKRRLMGEQSNPGTPAKPVFREQRGSSSSVTATPLPVQQQQQQPQQQQVRSSNVGATPGSSPGGKAREKRY